MESQPSCLLHKLDCREPRLFFRIDLTVEVGSFCPFATTLRAVPGLTPVVAILGHRRTNQKNGTKSPSRALTGSEAPGESLTMIGEHRTSVPASLQRLLMDGTMTGLSEAQLLERFLARGDQSAFEAIVMRHGPMVLGVCRRLLGDPHDVEDAFQATFLILLRKAGTIRDRQVLGTWLYGVARGSRCGCEPTPGDDGLARSSGRWKWLGTRITWAGKNRPSFERFWMRKWAGSRTSFDLPWCFATWRASLSSRRPRVSGVRWAPSRAVCREHGRSCVRASCVAAYRRPSGFWPPRSLRSQPLRFRLI